MGITERKQRQKEELRKGIISEARRLMQEDGCEALSIRKIADAIEYSVPVVYEHFENKDALLHEFVKEGFSLLAGHVGEVAQQHTSPPEKLKAIGRAYWNFAFSHKEYYKLMFGLGIPSCETVRQVQEVSLFSDILINTIEELQEVFHAKTNVFLKFHALWSMLHGLVSINLLNEGEEQSELNHMVLNDLLEVFIKGIKN